MIKPATLRDLSYITANLRQADLDEIACQFECFDPLALAFMTLNQSVHGYAWVASHRDQLAGAFGFAYVSALDMDIWQAWGFGTDRFKRVVPEISRFGRKVVRPRLDGETVRRIQAYTLTDHDIAHGWLAGFGARHEGTLRSYGRNGEDFDIYAWVK